ncbi:P-loop containing nucleoside triphosphate hydrolase protein [Piedraia hortae CBS 480.64]|uniref:P-loop containing nucleoside triphosphate hydrolase protein n=1 Tax=Piedraia hortae CBS 480.64 TaxID=1314780 RepID=A0A6A7BTE7_9PEZI|nr:P-loop containing nucleoside triphosphate hydrolase protein [Piedraia hortae CBS 480.64]
MDGAEDDASDVGTVLYDDDDDEDEEALDYRATQAVQRQMTQYTENLAMEQGVIEEVFCRNFMCHSKLRIRLGPLINFIIGHNGSGKSAVLTALTMCLGGKATATNRGASLKSLIKQGEDNATLAVRIKNRGEGAYKAELYGNSIIVERHFSLTRGSGFKLKSADGRVVSTRKADLDDILDYYAFQLDNPINVLTQDMARQFLSNSSPADKYRFFIRGTQLESLDNDYNILEEHHDNIAEKLQRRREDIDALRAREEEAKRKKERFDTMRVLQEKIGEYRHMHAWAQVAEQERSLAEHQQAVADAQAAVQLKERDAEEASHAYAQHDETQEMAVRAVEQLREQMAPVEEARAVAKDRFDSNTRALANINAQRRNIREEIKRLRSTEKDLEGRIRDEQARIAGAEGTENAQRLAKLEELKGRAEEAKRELRSHEESLPDIVKRRDEAFHTLEAAKPGLTQHEETVQQAKLLLSRVQSSGSREWDAYRPNMDQLVRAVARETKWQHRPVGPIGKHVTLRADKMEWSSIIEKTFGGALEAFVVTNINDHRLLKDIMRRVKCEPPILMGEATPIDTRGHEPEDPNVDTIMRVLTIGDPLVRNQLIIHQFVEQICLIPDSQEGYDFLFKGQRPRNVRAVVSFAARRGCGIRYEFTRSDGQKASPVDKWEGPLRIQADIEQQAAMQREVVRQAELELEVERQKVRDRELALYRINQEITRFKRQAQDLKVAMQRAEDAVEEQTNLIERSMPQDGRLQELEHQLREAQNDLELSNNTYEDAIVEKDQCDARAVGYKAALDQAQEELSGCMAAIHRAQEKLTNIGHSRDESLQLKNRAIAAVENSKRFVEACQRKHEEQKARVEAFIRDASSVCARVPIGAGLTPQVIDERLERLTQDLRRQERELGGTHEELRLAYENAKLDHSRAKRAYDEMASFRDALLHALGYRRMRWEMFQKHISVRARCQFRYLLSERNFRGNLLINHQEKLLDIAVEPDLSRRSDAGREARTLSGGEKSFSTICLLLSIWEAMGSPIRCLDEFDVFMDNVNRATSMGLMIQAARRSVGRQFILITPQSMNNVEMGDDVKVHKMSDPERGQQVLPFTQER